MDILRLEHIHKQYAGHYALKDINLNIPKGGIYGLLGPNGAGKTSLIRIITQIIAPNEGKVYYKGKEMVQSDVLTIGYLPEERGLYKKMKVAEQLIYFAELKGLSKQEAKKRVKIWLEKLDLTKWWDKKLDSLSKGMQQKVQFIATVINNPDLIILDEPFSGFDPVNAEIIKQELIELKQNGTTIILSTHRMENVEELCDNLCILHRSQVQIQGDIASIKEKYKEHLFKISFKTDLPEFLELENNPIFTFLNRISNKEITFKIAEGYSLNQAIELFLSVGVIYEITEIIPSIKDIFISTIKSGSNE